MSEAATTGPVASEGGAPIPRETAEAIAAASLEAGFPVPGRIQALLDEQGTTAAEAASTEEGQA